MPPGERPVCRYFAQSCCKLPANECAFRHERPSASDTVCKFYLSGSCAYGTKCRLDHVKPAKPAPPARPPPPSRSQPAAPPPTAPRAVTSRPPPAAPPPSAPRVADARASWSSVAASGAELPLPAELEALRLEDGGAPPPPPPPKPPKAADPWASLSDGRAASEPEPAAAAEIAARTARVALRAEQLAASADVECGICLEAVLSKPSAAERSFGLLPGCAHAFCLACIRGWRASPQSTSAPVPGAAAAASEAHARTCPICRMVSFYVVPSPVWPRDDAEKTELMESYRARLGAIPCRHFAQGRGSCPFGSSCFFSHLLEDGSEAPAPARRYAATADGEEVRVVEPLRLSAFLG